MTALGQQYPEWSEASPRDGTDTEYVTTTDNVARDIVDERLDVDRPEINEVEYVASRAVRTARALAGVALDPTVSDLCDFDDDGSKLAELIEKRDAGDQEITPHVLGAAVYAEVASTLSWGADKVEWSESEFVLLHDSIRELAEAGKEIARYNVLIVSPDQVASPRGEELIELYARSEDDARERAKEMAEHEVQLIGTVDRIDDPDDDGVDDPWPITGRLTPQEHGLRATLSASEMHLTEDGDGDWLQRAADRAAREHGEGTTVEVRFDGKQFEGCSGFEVLGVADDQHGEGTA